jgi:DNA-binding IclR family transcriptional regulator
VPLGAALPMDRGSAGRALSGEVSRSGWVDTVGEREPGVASVSAPIHGSDGSVVAAVSVSGPIGRLGRSPGRVHGPAVLSAALSVEAALDGRPV